MESNQYPQEANYEENLESTNKVDIVKIQNNTRTIEVHKFRIEDRLNQIESLKFAAKHNLGIAPLFFSLIQFSIALSLFIALLIVSIPIRTPIINYVIPFKGLAIFLIMLSVLTVYYSYFSVKIAYRRYRKVRKYLIYLESVSIRTNLLLDNINNKFSSKESSSIMKSISLVLSELAVKIIKMIHPLFL